MNCVEILFSSSCSPAQLDVSLKQVEIFEVMKLSAVSPLASRGPSALPPPDAAILALPQQNLRKSQVSFRCQLRLTALTGRKYILECICSKRI